MLQPLSVLQSLFGLTDDQNDPQYAMSVADLELLEQETVKWEASLHHS